MGLIEQVTRRLVEGTPRVSLDPRKSSLWGHDSTLLAGDAATQRALGAGCYRDVERLTDHRVRQHVEVAMETLVLWG